MTRDDDQNKGAKAEGEATEATKFLDRDPSGDQGSTKYVEPHERTDSSSGDRYLIGETLGEGGMAVVHQATDVQLHRPVAVKRLRPEYAAQGDIRQRFFAEAEILASLDHPGTTSVFEAGLLPDGDCFYAMKKVRGKTLGELMKERIPDDLLDRSNRAHFIEIFIRVLPGGGRRPQPGGDSPRPQARQHHGRRSRGCLCDGLGAGEAAGRGRRRQPVRLSANPPRRGDGHPGLHVTRAGFGPRRRVGPPDRRLFSRSDALRDPHRGEPLQGRDRGRVDEGRDVPRARFTAAKHNPRVTARCRRSP